MKNQSKLSTIKICYQQSEKSMKIRFDRWFRSTIDPKKLNTAILSFETLFFEQKMKFNLKNFSD
jgi:hypothetical protein